MWSEKTTSGKVRFVERYTNPLTEKTERVYVTLDKDTPATRKEALQLLNAKINEALRNATTPEMQKITLGELAKRYLDDRKDSVALSTQHTSTKETRLAVNLIGRDVIANKLTAGYIRERLALERKASLYNSRLKRLKTILRWAYRNDYISDISYIDKLTPRPNPERKLKLKNKYLEREELSTLLSNMSNTRWRLLTEFLALSGLRCGEAFALLDSDVDIEAKTITVSKTLYGIEFIPTTPKTPASNREIHIQPELEKTCRKIKRYIREQQLRHGIRTDLFIPGENGYIRHRVYHRYLTLHATEAIGRPITPHTLRHTHVSLLAEAGVDLDTISRRLGHQDSGITRQVYYHVTKQKEAEENRKLDKIKLL